MQIRNEKPEDRSAIATLIAKTYMADGARTIEITGMLRDLPSYDVNCTFIAEEDDNIIAYALFTHVKIGDNGKALLLAPLAIEINKNIDVDGFLNKSFEKLKSLNYNYILMHGSADEHKDIGFESAINIGIDDGLNVDGVDLLIKNISDKTITETGKVSLPECLK